MSATRCFATFRVQVGASLFLLRRPHVWTLNRPVVFSPQVQAAAAAWRRNVWHGVEGDQPGDRRDGGHQDDEAALCRLGGVRQPSRGNRRMTTHRNSVLARGVAPLRIMTKRRLPSRRKASACERPAWHRECASSTLMRALDELHPG